MDNTVLKIDRVSIGFGGGAEAVSDVSVEVLEKDRTIIIGETGSGKSVLLQGILHLLPERARIEGRILFGGVDLIAASERELNRIRGRRIAYIPQGSGNGLNPLYSVGHQLCESIMKYTGLDRRQALVRARELLKTYGMENGEAICRMYPFQLSGGMRQRVLIAMGVAADAELVLADEPTKGLDQRRIDMVTESFRLLRGHTMLCVTHDLRFAKEIASKIVVMYASQKVESASAADFFERPLHPYAQAMLDALPENGLRVNLGFAPPRERDERSLGMCRFYDRCPYRAERCMQAPPLVRVGDREVRCWRYAD